MIPTPSTPPPPETLNEYIALLPPWEASLFEGLGMHLDCYTLVNTVMAITPKDHDSRLHLISLSDGSAINKSMSLFGWVLSLPTSERVATCSGPAPGSVQSSFRAERYGLLSIACFLHHLFCFYGVDSDIKIQLSCDNDPLLCCVKSALLHPNCFPNSTLQPGWDIIDAIIKTIQSMACSIILSHIMGHQDDKVAHKKLPLVAQAYCGQLLSSPLFGINTLPCETHATPRRTCHRFRNMTNCLLLQDCSWTPSPPHTKRQSPLYRHCHFHWWHQRRPWDIHQNPIMTNDYTHSMKTTSSRNHTNTNPPPGNHSILRFLNRQHRATEPLKV
jgi:hypothetical protein